MRTALPIRTVFTLLLLATASTARAQTDRVTRFLDGCRTSRGDDERFCETRDFTIPAGGSINVDGRENGGITVHAWDHAETKVTAMIQAQAQSAAEAQSIAKQITVTTNGAEVRAEGPGTNRRESWSVSYEIWAPPTAELSLTASNGGISVDGMSSRMTLETVNGSLHLTDVSGDVRATTTNGGVTAELSGNRWNGAGLDLRTTNGGVRLYLPENYSAQLEASTVNGGFDVGFPIRVQGSFGRRLTTQLGGGGPLIRATTTNGGVSIRRR